MNASTTKLRARFILTAVLLVGAALFVLVRSGRESSPTVESGSLSDKTVQKLAAQFAVFEAREQHVAETAWAKELLAQECGRTFEALWDSLNAATNKLGLIAVFPVGEIVLGKWDSSQSLGHGIELRRPSASGPVLDGDDWRQRIEEFGRAGWNLAQTEFRHNRFETDEAGQPRQSHFYFAAHLVNPLTVNRAVVEGDLVVEWGAKPAGPEPPPINRIDASQLKIKTRHGETPFRLVLNESVAPPPKSESIDPLILYDLDGDGLPEIILAGSNLVYRRRGDDRYEAGPLCQHPPGAIHAAVMADFDGDGAADFLCAKPEGLVLFPGSAQGRFDHPGRQVWTASPRLANAMVLTCGDIDHDGDLDVFLGQYKVPTLGQVLKPNFHDANDGHPAFLLRNDGHGSFTDVTMDSGLEPKRGRRMYSASFVDLNDDGHPDLMVVSDFAGVDLYRNDGEGRFTDVTREWIAEPHAFGMGHALADFNSDGRLDFLMTGMNSPTVDRLEHLGLRRPDAPEDPTMRSRMTFGNRLYLAKASGGFEQTPMSDSIARSGWSWGCSAFDFDNDGFPDVYVANGLESKKSVRDYEPEFWLHDIYVDDSVDELTTSAYFTGKFSRTRGQGWSYGGYEKNRLYFNRRGREFLETGYLMGVALEQDSRNVVSGDLDGDGGVDLLLTTFEVWPERKQTLQAYRNAIPERASWIGFRFREEGERKSPVGVCVTIHYGDRQATQQIVTGDSHRSQHANVIHFGLGAGDRVDRVEIRWPDGEAVTLRDSAVNRYHSIHAPSKRTVRR